MASTLEVLAEPNRRRILDLLLAGERPVGRLVEETDLSQPSLRSAATRLPTARRAAARG
jgi:DNA-binding transcriptional ArsR family regulator